MSKPKLDKLPAADWLPFFKAAGIRAEEFDACKSERSRAIKLGQFLSPKVGREVPIQVGGRTGKAVLRVEQERSKAKLYYLEVQWDSPVPGDDNVHEDNPGASGSINLLRRSTRSIWSIWAGTPLPRSSCSRTFGTESALS